MCLLTFYMGMRRKVDTIFIYLQYIKYTYSIQFRLTQYHTNILILSDQKDWIPRSRFLCSVIDCSRRYSSCIIIHLYFFLWFKTIYLYLQALPSNWFMNSPPLHPFPYNLPILNEIFLAVFFLLGPLQLPLLL